MVPLIAKYLVTKKSIISLILISSQNKLLDQVVASAKNLGDGPIKVPIFVSIADHSLDILSVATSSSIVYIHVGFDLLTSLRINVHAKIS